MNENVRWEDFNFHWENFLLAFLSNVILHILFSLARLFRENSSEVWRNFNGKHARKLRSCSVNLFYIESQIRRDFPEDILCFVFVRREKLVENMFWIVRRDLIDLKLQIS